MPPISTHPSPAALLRKYGLRPKKSWGQHFLGDDGILGGIAQLAVGNGGERIVEIGPGLGHLTWHLLKLGADLIAVERDRDMARVLRGEFDTRLELIEKNAAHLDYRSLAAPQAKCTVVGNLPYHLSSPILFDLLDQSAAIGRAILLLQLEVAERLAADPGTRTWGLLSVLLQQKADVRIARRVPRGAFQPPPKVESAVIEVAFRPPTSEVDDEAAFRKLVKAGFGQRRKTLANSLKGAGLPQEKLTVALKAAAIDPIRRAETLLVSEWVALARELSARSEKN